MNEKLKKVVKETEKTLKGFLPTNKHFETEPSESTSGEKHWYDRQTVERTALKADVPVNIFKIFKGLWKHWPKQVIIVKYYLMYKDNDDIVVFDTGIVNTHLHQSRNVERLKLMSEGLDSTLDTTIEIISLYDRFTGTVVVFKDCGDLTVIGYDLEICQRRPGR